MPDQRPDVYEGATVVVQKGAYMKTTRIHQGRTVIFGKRGEGQFTLNLDGALGCAFGSSYKMERVSNKLFNIKQIEEDTSLKDIVKEGGEDNRNIFDDGRSQKLSPEEISRLRGSGLSGKEVIQTLTENSTTFKSKTKFSQEKYVNKKQRKYDEAITLMRPSIRLLCSMYYTQDPLKIANLRIDSLSQLLCHANVQAAGRFGVFESGTQGLVTAAMLQRMGTMGHLVQIYHGNHPQREAIDLMNFTTEELEVLSFINCTKVPDKDTETSTNGVTCDLREEESKDLKEKEELDEKTERLEQNVEDKINPEKEEMETSNSEIKEEGENNTKSEVDESKPTAEQQVESKPVFKRPRKFVRTLVEDVQVSIRMLMDGLDGLVVACRQHPSNITLELLQFLKPGHPFVVFSPYKEPLMELFAEAKMQGATNLRLTETWLRHYQVLPQRTHPEINMSGGGGYLLYGTRIRTHLP